MRSTATLLGVGLLCACTPDYGHLSGEGRFQIVVSETVVCTDDVGTTALWAISGPPGTSCAGGLVSYRSACELVRRVAPEEGCPRDYGMGPTNASAFSITWHDLPSADHDLTGRSSEGTSRFLYDDTCSPPEEEGGAPVYEGTLDSPDVVGTFLVPDGTVVQLTGEWLGEISSVRCDIDVR